MTVSNEMESGQVVIGTQENPWGRRNNENSGLFTAFHQKVEHSIVQAHRGPGSRRKPLRLGDPEHL